MPPSIVSPRMHVKALRKWEEGNKAKLCLTRRFLLHHSVFVRRETFSSRDQGLKLAAQRFLCHTTRPYCHGCVLAQVAGG
jgi:hypothetical protein